MIIRKSGLKVNMLTKEKPETIERMFAEISPSYDRLNRILSFGLDLRWRNAVRRAIPFSTAKLLDCCTGTGDLAILLAKNGFEVTGIDFCKPMIEIAHRKSPRGVSLNFLEGDVHQIPFPDRSFHVLTNAFSLRNLTDLRKVFAEAHRVLAPKGVALFLELTRPPGFLGALHQYYLGTVLPFVGGVISGNRNAYHYLAQSIKNFPSTLEIANLLRAARFEKIQIHPLSGGIATLWIAWNSY